MATPNTNVDEHPHGLEDDVETSTATAFVVANIGDIEEGTPVIRLPPVQCEGVGEASEDDALNEPVSVEPTAIIVTPDEIDSNLSPEDLESTPIAHHVQQHPSPDLLETGTTTTMNQENNSLPLLERRAEFISATLIKSTPDTPVGLGLICNPQTEVLINSIAPNTLAEHTPFQKGDRLLSVNAKRCYTMDAKDTAKFLASQVGRVTIVVHNQGGDPNLVESMVTRSEAQERCGLGLHSTGRRNLRISNIESDGLFFDSLLNTGDPLVSINGQDCTRADARDAGDLIAQAGKYITIKARTLLETGVVVAAFSCNNSTGSTIPPQISNALNKVLYGGDDMLPSTKQLASLMLAAMFLLALLLLSGIMH